MLSQKKGEPWDVDLSTPRKDCLLPTLLNRSVFIPIPILKECSNYCTTALIAHASELMPKILQARLQQYVNQDVSDVQVAFRKGRGTRDQITNIHWIIEKAREFQKDIYFCFIDYAKAFDCVDHSKLQKILQNTRPPDLPPEKFVSDFCIQISQEAGKWFGIPIS